jgi:hypothetical protein
MVDVNPSDATAKAGGHELGVASLIFDVFDNSVRRELANVQLWTFTNGTISFQIPHFSG